MVSSACAKRHGLMEEDLDEIGEIEAPIPDDWFVERTNEDGEVEVWLRVQVTRLYPRRLGPFDDRYEALLVLSCFLCGIENKLPDLIKDDERGIRLVIEDELASAYTQQSREAMPGDIIPMSQDRIEAQWGRIRSTILDASNQFDARHPTVNPWPINRELEGFVKTALEYYMRDAGRFGVDRKGRPKTTCAAKKGGE